MPSIKHSFKKLLYQSLGQEAYLKLLNQSFYLLYDLGLLKNDPAYQYHYFVKNFLRKGDVVLDIGANLGYYTRLFARCVGKEGHVYAVEPVAIFRKVLEWATRKHGNITLLPYALGSEEKEIFLVTPDNFGFLRTGLPHVFDGSDGKKIEQYEFKFKAEMRRGSQLFKDLPRVDYLKCDVEGHEKFVLPEMRELLAKHKPIIQVEIGAENQPFMDSFFQGLGYEKYCLENEELKPDSKRQGIAPGDWIFIHPQNNSAARLLVTGRFPTE